ncbi:MAG: TIGR00299 family protein [Clostridiales bacterium 41_21_two_genomes]|nr:MAG: TIGR00299 family protein [Clostridiales bacterium 41_21_two_genomes]
MKKVYFECNMGAAGDMLCGALLDAVDKNKRAEIVEKINSVGFPNAKISAVDDVKRGLVGTKFNVYVTAQNAHSHTSISEVFEIINTLNFEECVKNDAKSIYKIIADAESAAHGISVADVHLHEVGMIDAIVDVVSFCFIKKELEIDKIYASPITVGYGSVKTAHGIMNVPAPATAAILADVPIKGGDIEDELCTPTGAAILKYFCTDFSVLGDFEYDCVGVGNGTKDFERANCVRAFVGNCDSDDVCELRCQIDDMTGEEMGYAINKLLALGALDAYVQNIVMKKSRPAFLLTVIVNRIDKSLFIRQIFKHTTTLGVRILECERYRLSREIKEYEKVRVKRSSGFGTEKIKIEYDDIAKFADENNLSFFKAREQLIDKIDK